MRSSSKQSARSHAARGGICDARDPLERLAIRPGKRDGRVPGYARGETMAVEDG